ncbi:hypothetical protein [Blautia sp. AF34-10]|nr:hypothetical protein [Blautia sp. AF34-10]
MYSELIFPLNSNDPVLLEIPVIITQAPQNESGFRWMISSMWRPVSTG